MKKLYTNYINTFKGLSTEVWWLALITFINRSGTMIIPFLSLYLREDMKISQTNVGWVMTCFGLGSVAGAWLGGKLTDKIGYYKVMVRSLLSTGFLFIGLQFLDTFAQICIGIFLVMTVADTFRPAMYVAMSVYSKPKNKTRSVTLIRLAINLGFSAGPAIGGLIIATIGYSGLFWVDGITCILATVLLVSVLNPRKAKAVDTDVNDNPISVNKDKPYWIFFAAMVLFAFIFMQYFSTMPLYYKDIHLLSEPEIGYLLGLNGLIIFLIEMPIIAWLENSNYTKIGLTLFGLALTILSLFVLNITPWLGILVIGIVLMTIGEMIGFPMSNAFAMHRSKRGKQGEYLAMYVMAFSIASIFSHNAGLQMSAYLGYEFTWYFMCALGVVGVLLLVYLKRILKKKNELY
ncbi:putative MFS family arabinose efflux permease [Winogradskyella wandonensis]|uniref:Putative MFS family arabinose efflux permease n=1 Tax=Winogradskyella wandonensis TaxID=1442586 RepID=A0A4R1KWD5_9FLAO|nr:MFS transporter [Winogradskyella wandonensis]TCK68709.1 putative MFS family arabinose efflux permease [Winogradskyella wandonensis]